MTATAAMADLLPCPFCGRAVQFRKALWPIDGDCDGINHAEPTDCPLHFESHKADESVIADWNRRSLAEPGEVVIGYVSPSSLDALDKCRKDDHNGMVDLWMRPTEFATIPLYTHPAAPAGVSEEMVERARTAHSVDRISNGEVIDKIAGRAYGDRLIRGIIEAALGAR